MEDGPLRSALKRNSAFTLENAKLRKRISELEADNQRLREALPQLRFTPLCGKVAAEEKARMRDHPLYRTGDAIAVWVNEGDLAALQIKGVASAALIQEEKP